MLNNKISLSARSAEIILGSILGDGSLRIHHPYRNARFSFRHSSRQQTYFYWKANELKEIASDKAVWRQGNEQRPDGWGTVKLRFQSRALPALTKLWQFVAKNNKFEVRRKWLNRLTPLSLAVWWMDDGSLVSDTRQGVLCTDGFSYNEVKIIDRYLKKVWHINTAIGQVKETNRYRIWIRSTRGLQDFLRIIIPYIPVEEMLSKVILLYKDPNLQQRWISEVTDLSSFSRQTVEKYARQKRDRYRAFRE